jgi:DNA-binding MarR family transcriptional regulator
MDALTLEDRQRAQRLLLIVSRLGATLSAALHSRVDPAFASNVEVLVITSLDLLGSQRPSDILALTGMTSGGVTRVLDRLEEHGLMVREFGHVAGDRRGTRLLLTPEGRRIAAELAAGLASRMDAVREAIEHLRDTAAN